MTHLGLLYTELTLTISEYNSPQHDFSTHRNMNFPVVKVNISLIYSSFRKEETEDLFFQEVLVSMAVQAVTDSC